MATVTPVASVEALERAIQKSGLLSADGLAKVHEAAAHAKEPKQLARDLVKNGTLTRWQAEQLLHGFHRLIVGKYKLLDQIGASPSGRIYLAEHVQIGRRHALKVLAKRLASNPKAVKRFLAAAQGACGLDHRNVSHCYDVTQDHERHSHYVVMEYVEGETLERIVERTGRLDPQLALNYAVQAADGLIHAHQNGVIHGDLKPANLVLDSTGTIKILEMGQASAGATFEAEGADESVEMAALGAVIFQPPELRGDGEIPTIACDIYSLGSVLTFLLTAKAAPDAQAAAERLKEAQGIPSELVELCQHMMAEKPADRPTTIAEVADQLVACAQKMAADQSQIVAQADEKASASGKGKTKKPPVAKPLDNTAVTPIIIPGVSHSVVEAAAPEPFVIKTRGRIGKKPSVQPAAAPANDPSESPAPAPTQSTFTPLVLGAIGGGVFVVLGLLIAAVCLLLYVSRRSKAPVVQTLPAASASQNSSTVASEESNPLAPTVERNPEVDPAPALPEATLAIPNSAPNAAASPAQPELLAANRAGETTAQVSAAQPEPPPVPSTEPSPEKTTAQVEAKPPAQAEAKAPPAKPAPKSQPKTPPKVEPFQGFAKAVALPALTEANGQAAVLASPTILGPCKLDDKTGLDVKLAGGDTAVRGTKHRFELQPKADANQAWDIFVNGVGSASNIATLTADGSNLYFQWTEEAGKQFSIVKQFCNCAFQLTAGAAKHTVALRTPLVGQPLAIDIEKPGATTRLAIGDLPQAKQLFLEVLSVEFPKTVSVEPKQPVGIGEDISIWFGDSSDVLPLTVKLDTSTNSRDLEIKQQPSIKLEGQEPRLYRKKDMQTLHQQTMQQLTLVSSEHEAVKKSNPKRDLDKQLREQKLELLGKQRLAAGAILEQINFTVGFAEKYRGAALVHLRLYYQAGDEKVDLMRTTETVAPTKPK